MQDAGPSDGDRPRPLVTPLIRREIVLLVVLSVAAVILFLITRALAGWSRDTRVEEAASAYARGIAAEAAGDPRAAVEEFRRAVFSDRDTPEYRLHLAAALAEMPGGADEADRILWLLREDAPDDSEINYRLARLAARRGDVATAVRFYNHAMYGQTSEGATLDRQGIRTELIGVLLDHGDRQGAVAELAALGRELPETVEAHLSTARLAMRAGEHRLALDQFRRAAALDPDSLAAQAGAGEAALALFDFRAALRHLQAARDLGADDVGLAADLAAAHLADTLDPLAAGLPLTERARRLAVALDWMSERVAACPLAAVGSEADAAESSPESSAGDHPDRREIDRLAALPASSLRDGDLVEAGVDLLTRVHARVAARCPDPSPVSRAWTLVGQAHAVPDR